MRKTTKKWLTVLPPEKYQSQKERGRRERAEEEGEKKEKGEKKDVQVSES